MESCKRKEEIEATAPKKRERARKVEVSREINHPPVVSELKVIPDQPTTETDITVVAVGKDMDGDFVDLKYQWFKNGDRLIGEIGEKLSHELFKRGDFIQVKVTPNDRFGEGVSRMSDIKEILNSPPRLLTNLTAGQDLNGVKLEVFDPDGDRVVWTMEGAPPGMSLSEDGTIHFSPSFDHEGGEWNTKLTCSDKNGGSIEITIPIRLKPGIPPVKRIR